MRRKTLRFCWSIPLILLEFLNRNPKSTFYLFFYNRTMIHPLIKGQYVCRSYQKEDLPCNLALNGFQSEEADQNVTEVYLIGLCQFNHNLTGSYKLSNSLCHKGFLPVQFFVWNGDHEINTASRTAEAFKYNFTSFYQSSKVYKKFSEQELNTLNFTPQNLALAPKQSSNGNGLLFFPGGFLSSRSNASSFHV